MRTIAFFGVAIIEALAACGPASSQSHNNIRQCLSISNVDQRVGCLEAAAEDRRRDLQSAVPQSPFSPPPGQLSLKEILDPVKGKLESCLINHFKQSFDNRVTPPDFSRIVEGSCYTEANDYHQALQRWWSSGSPRTAYEARAYSDKFIRSTRNEIVSIYTQRWYAAAPKQKAPKATPKVSAGTGFFITRDGHILTNSHVVADCQKITIRTVDGTTAAATLLVRKEKDDLAVLKTAATVSEPARLRSKSTPRTGEPIVVFGFPYAGILTSTGNATTGNITGAEGMKGDPRHVQISAPIQPGNSGGPLLDMRGNVVGIVFSQLDALKIAVTLGDIPQNINFAIKGLVAASLLDAQGISYLATQSEKELSVPDVVEAAKGISVAILCEGDQATSEQKPSIDVQKEHPEKSGAQTPSQLSARTSAFLVRLYSALSSPNVDAINFVSDIYADNLQYYGKLLSRDQVLAQIVRLIERWPLRKYKTKEGSVSIQCDAKALVCAVKGTIEFDSRSPARNERSSGLATFEYTLSYASPTAVPKITVEGGAIIEQRKELLSSDSSFSR